MDEAVNTQRTSLIKRNSDSFADCFVQSGVKTTKTFTLDECAGLKKEMPFELWRTVKRAMKEALGYDALSSEKQLRSHLEKYYYKYECGTFQFQKSNVTFVRVSDFKEVLLQMVADAETHAHPNIDPSTLVGLICGDKGSSTTKLMFQMLNLRDHNSVKNAKMLGIYEGAKDSRECVELVRYYNNI